MAYAQYNTPEKAWAALRWYVHETYAPLAAMYTGDPLDLKRTGKPRSFWRRAKDGTAIHVPIAADIASTSADLLFSHPPKCTVFHGDDRSAEEEQQARLNEILDLNRFPGKLSEAAETASALGDVYFKLRWTEDADMPLIDIVQPDSALPEYAAGRLARIHFFTPLFVDYEKNRWIRVYECYELGRIASRLYSGDAENLGTALDDAKLQEMGIAPIAELPTSDLPAVHIPNLRPNRRFRESMRGRSDLDGLRGLCDALDEAYSSWIRDVRLAKARTIVPAEYLRRKPSEMIEGLSHAGSWEFDAEVETYVAMDIDPATSKTGITLQQYDIRSAQHAETCRDLIERIVTHAGYSPQSFGMDINGTAQSGTALTIRERRSLTTRERKTAYWTDAVEALLTAAIHLDAALFAHHGMHPEDKVKLEFAAAAEIDLQSVSSAVESLYRAQAVSLETRVAMQHPDWDSAQRQEEIDRIREEFAIGVPDPVEIDPALGAAESEPAPEEAPQSPGQPGDAPPDGDGA